MARRRERVEDRDPRRGLIARMIYRGTALPGDNGFQTAGIPRTFALCAISAGYAELLLARG